MIEYIMSSFGVIVGLFCVLACVCVAVYEFTKEPDEDQKEKVKQWLVWACVEAEKSLSSGTGQLKLRQVWNNFCSVPAFSSIAKVVTFSMFESLVKDSLKKAKEMIVGNKSLAEYVYGDNAQAEVEKIKEQLK